MAIFSKLLSVQRSFYACARRISSVNQSVTGGYLCTATRGRQLQQIGRGLSSSACHQQDQIRQDQKRHQGSIGKQQQNAQPNFVVRSPYPDIEIPDDVSLPHLMINSLPKYGNATALVSDIELL